MPFLIALQFLTRFPVRLSRLPKAEEHGTAAAYFPMAGLLAGLLLMGCRQLAAMDKVNSHFLPLGLAILLFWVWFCDSLHLDGLADTFDGLASHKKGKPMLKVMHLGNTGAFGSVALSLSLLAKFIFLVSFPGHLNWLLPVPLMISRLFLTWGCSQRPYAGTRGSLSSRFFLNTQGPHLNAALFLTLAALAGIAGPAWYLGMATGLELAGVLLVCAASLVLGGLALQIPRLRLGGVTGDLCGYGQQITELAAAYGLLFLLAR